MFTKLQLCIMRGGTSAEVDPYDMYVYEQHNEVIQRYVHELNSEIT